MSTYRAGWPALCQYAELYDILDAARYLIYDDTSHRRPPLHVEKHTLQLNHPRPLCFTKNCGISITRAPRCNSGTCGAVARAESGARLAEGGAI